jgi:hypothetical protein
MHMLGASSFQPAEVCTAVVARFAAPDRDLETDRSMVAGLLVGSTPGSPRIRKIPSHG